MSYCRFSSDNWKSDVYVYESSGGFVTVVAGNRLVGDVPPLLPIKHENTDEWLAAYRAQRNFMETAEHAPIELPHAGEGFTDYTAADCVARLLQLRALGYHVPQCAIDSLCEEAA